MSPWRLLLLPLVALALAGCGGASAPDGEDGSEVLAEVDGEAITRAEVDARIRDDLFRQQMEGSSRQAYQLRRRTLDAMIEERVIQEAAAERGVAPEELLQAELAERGAVTDEEVEAFYAENQSRFGAFEIDELRPRIRAYLEQRQAEETLAALRGSADVQVHLGPPRVSVAPEGPSRGPEDAPVTIVEFSDFQCPYCRRAQPVIERLLERYEGHVRLVYRHLPLDSIHPRAQAAAEASACAAAQDAFWPYHDKLFENAKALERDDLVGYAEELGLDTDQFAQCVEERRFREQVAADAAAAQQAGITGTPAFVVNGLLISGAQPVEEFAEVIDAELARAGISPPVVEAETEPPADEGTAG